MSDSSSSSLDVLGFFVNLEEAFELQDRSGDAEVVAGGVGYAALPAEADGIDIHGGLVEDGGGHLAGDEALPDEFVDLEFILLQERDGPRPECAGRSWDGWLRALPARSAPWSCRRWAARA